MNEKTKRLIAIFTLIIPGLGATYGFLAMKDAWFAQFGDNGAFHWGKFILGLILFVLGVAFIGGWVFYRDRKHNYVAPRFREKRETPPPRKKE